MAAPPKKPIIRWFGKKTKAAVRKRAYDGLRRATAFVQGQIKVVISKPAMVGKGGAKSPSAKSKRKPRRYQHSKPGEPPRAITGKLRQSIFQSTDRKRMLGSVGTTLKYGANLERGVSAHDIRANRKKSLAFPGWVQKEAEYKIGTAMSIAGRQIVKGGVKKRKGERSEWGWIFRRKVRHPGIKPRPFLWVTVKKNKAKIRKIILGRIGALFKGGKVTFGGKV